MYTCVCVCASTDRNLCDDAVDSTLQTAQVLCSVVEAPNPIRVLPLLDDICWTQTRRAPVAPRKVRFVSLMFRAKKHQSYDTHTKVSATQTVSLSLSLSLCVCVCVCVYVLNHLFIVRLCTLMRVCEHAYMHIGLCICFETEGSRSCHTLTCGLYWDARYVDIPNTHTYSRRLIDQPQWHVKWYSIRVKDKHVHR